MNPNPGSDHGGYSHEGALALSSIMDSSLMATGLPLESLEYMLDKMADQILSSRNN